MKIKDERNRVKVFDTTLRDGEQSPGFQMSAPEKMRMAEQLARVGVDVIEAGFPVSSPEDFEAVHSIARTIGQRSNAPEIAGLARCVDEDIDAVIKAIEPATHGRIHIVIATSDIHAKHKLKMTRAQILERIETSVTRAVRSGRHVQFSAEDASRSDPAFLMFAMETAMRAGARTINVPDTVGYAMPDEFAGIVRAICRATEKFPGTVVSVHCHDDLGMATANSLSGLRAGARQVETAVNGIGERAGNCALEEIVMAIRTRAADTGLWTGVRTEELVPASRTLFDITGQPIAPNKSVVGENAFAHASGIHQDGILKNAMTYEIMTPEEVGAPKSRLVLTSRSGRNAIRSRLEDLGMRTGGEEIEKIYVLFKAAADQRRFVDDETLRSLAREAGIR